MTELYGFLDRMRENLETLDEQIANARVMSKKKGNSLMTRQRNQNGKSSSIRR